MLSVLPLPNAQHPPLPLMMGGKGGGEEHGGVEQGLQREVPVHPAMNTIL